MPKVPVENAENYRVPCSQPADFSQLPVRSEPAAILAVIVRRFRLENHFLDAIFLGKFCSFYGTETNSQSITCADGIRGAQKKHYVSTGTLSMEIKPTPETISSLVRLAETFHAVLNDAPSSEPTPGFDAALDRTSLTTPDRIGG
jgi:hypothetical protein